jgi:hypothetical protein
MIEPAYLKKPATNATCRSMPQYVRTTTNTQMAAVSSPLFDYLIRIEVDSATIS